MFLSVDNFHSFNIFKTNVLWYNQRLKKIITENMRLFLQNIYKWSNPKD